MAVELVTPWTAGAQPPGASEEPRRMPRGVVPPKDRKLGHLPTSPRAMLVKDAFWKLGAVFPAGLQRILKQARPQAFWGLWGRVLGVHAKLPVTAKLREIGPWGCDTGAWMHRPQPTRACCSSPLGSHVEVTLLPVVLKGVARCNS